MEPESLQEELKEGEFVVRPPPRSLPPSSSSSLLLPAGYKCGSQPGAIVLVLLLRVGTGSGMTGSGPRLGVLLLLAVLLQTLVVTVTVLRFTAALNSVRRARARGDRLVNAARTHTFVLGGLTFDTRKIYARERVVCQCAWSLLRETSFHLFLFSPNATRSMLARTRARTSSVCMCRARREKQEVEAAL